MIRKYAFGAFLAVFLSASVFCGTAFGQELKDSVERVTVTGTRLAMSLNQSARIVTVLDSLCISNSPSDNVNDLLKYAVGVDVRQRGAMGMQTDISVRGGTFDQIAILLNGINISDPQTGHNAVDFPVNLSDIDHIEVLEGPSSRVYGTSSLVGAINIVTRSSASNEAVVQLEAGGMGTVSANASAIFGTGSFSHHVSAGGQRSDGFSRSSGGNLNNDFQSGKAYYHLRGDFSRRDLDLQAGMSLRNFGSSTFYSSKFDDQFEHTAKTFLSLSSSGKGFWHLKPSVYWNYSADRFELFRGAPDKYPFNYHRTNVLGAGLSGKIETVIGRTVFGGEVRREGIRSTNLGEPLETPHGKYVVGLDRYNYSLFLEHNVLLSRFTASAGLLAFRSSLGDEPMRLYPGVDASWRFAGNWKLYASVNSSFRTPTFTDLYYSVGGHKADKNLKAEKMISYEGGVKYLSNGFSAVLSVYYHRGHDMIDWIKDTSAGEDAPWTSVNHTVLSTFGQEVSLRWNFPRMLGRKYFFISKLDAAYSHISQSKELENGLLSMYAMEYLRHKVVVQADFRLAKSLSLNLSYRFQDRESTDPSLKPYSLVDARLEWQRGKYSLYLKANNLLDADYLDFGAVRQPGIWLLAGLRVNMHL